MPGATLNKKLAFLHLLHLHISRYVLPTQHPQYLVLIILLKPPRMGACKIFFRKPDVHLFTVPEDTDTNYSKKSISQTLKFLLIVLNCSLSLLLLPLSHTKRLGGAVALD